MYYIEEDGELKKELHAILEKTGKVSAQDYKITDGKDEERIGKGQQRKKEI